MAAIAAATAAEVELGCRKHAELTIEIGQGPREREMDRQTTD